MSTRRKLQRAPVLPIFTSRPLDSEKNKQIRAQLPGIMTAASGLTPSLRALGVLSGALQAPPPSAARRSKIPRTSRLGVLAVVDALIGRLIDLKASYS